MPPSNAPTTRASPDPDDYTLYHRTSGASSRVSTPSTVFSDTDTLFDFMSPGVSSKGKELEFPLQKELGSDVAQQKEQAAAAIAPGARLLARLLA